MWSLELFEKSEILGTTILSNIDFIVDLATFLEKYENFKFSEIFKKKFKNLKSYISHISTIIIYHIIYLHHILIIFIYYITFILIYYITLFIYNNYLLITNNKYLLLYNNYLLIIFII